MSPNASQGVGGRRDGKGERTMVPKPEFRSYYGRPVIKEPVWKPEVPWYFFSGGLGGASATLAFAAGVAGNRELARRSWLVSLGAISASPVLLIMDLGRPERFLNMLRVFKPTSPMSVGSWLLALTGASVTAATAHETLGLFAKLGRLTRVTSGVLGLPMATYTAALIGNTAVPVWHEARRTLPFVFAAGAAASAGAAATAVTPADYAGPARRLTVGGALLATTASQVMERRLGELAEPYHEGAAGRYARAAKGLTLAGAGMVAFARRRRAGAVAGSALVLAGAVLERWAVFKAGFQSASDPRHTIGPQRQRAQERSRTTVR